MAEQIRVRCLCGELVSEVEETDEEVEVEVVDGQIQEV